MKFILGKKTEMTQKFKADGSVAPVTAVQAGPCVITALKTEEKDGYSAVQVGYGEKKKINKPLAGHLKNLGKLSHLREFRIKETEGLKIGDRFDIGMFAPGDLVKVTGISKGKGFQGVVKRHGFHGSPKTHGHKDQLRHSGSIGAGGVQNVFKGMRMAGHMGDDQVTVKNLEVIEIDKENNLLYLKGAVPGGRNSFLMISGEGEFKLTEEKKEEVKPEETKEEPKKEEARAEENKEIK